MSRLSRRRRLILQKAAGADDGLENVRSWSDVLTVTVDVGVSPSAMVDNAALLQEERLMPVLVPRGLDLSTDQHRFKDPDTARILTIRTIEDTPGRKDLVILRELV